MPPSAFISVIRGEPQAFPLARMTRRSLALLAALTCIVSVAQVGPADSDRPKTPDWLGDITRVAYTDLSNTRSAGDWPEKVISDFADAGVQMMVSRAQSGDSWDGLGWKSRFGNAASNMKGDGTREVTDLCHKHGLRYLAYYLAQRETKNVGEEHPDWRCRNNEGKPTQYFCLNTPYRDLVRNRAVELVQDVGVDGIFFDMLHTRKTECYCDTCREKFRALTGQNPPLKEDFDDILWQQWVDFKYRGIENAMLDFNRAIKVAKPEAALVVNTWNDWVYRSSNTRNSIRMAEVVDGVLEETGWYDAVDPSFFAFPAYHNYMDWHLAGLCKPGQRAFMWGHPHLPGVFPLTAMETKIRVLTMMTNGSVPAHSVPGRDTLKTYMADIAERDEFARGARVAPWCGLVVSEKTELWYGRDNPKDRYVKGVYGAFQTMLERHLPVSLVTDRDLERGETGENQVLFMPNCAAMSEAELQTVRSFVEKGGGLVATYETSAYDEHGKLRPNFGLADLFQVKRTGRFENTITHPSSDPKKFRTATLRFGEKHRWSSDRDIFATLSLSGVSAQPGTVNRSIPLRSLITLVEPEKNVAATLRLATALYNPATGQIDRTDTPALVETTFGKGKIIYLPFDISWSYFRFGDEYLGRLIELALRDAASTQPRVEVEAPSIVQSTTQIQGDRLVVHLLNDISSMGRSQAVAKESLYSRREVIPIHNIRVTFRDRSLKKFFLVPGRTPLPAQEDDRGLTVTVPRLDIHCMVVAEKE